MDDKGNPKDRQGIKKVPLRLTSSVARIYWAMVMAHGADKYGEFNWRNKDVKFSIYCEAIDRHNISMAAGEDIDPESGLPHAAHIIACASIILDADACGCLIDDRFEKDHAAALLTKLTAKTDYYEAIKTITRTPARTLGELRKLACAKKNENSQ